MKNYKYYFTSIAFILVVFLSFLSYGNTLKGKFIWDDNAMIAQNELIRNWQGGAKIFTQDIGYGAGQKVGFFRPLQLLTYMSDYSIWKLNPAGYHLTNILLHALAGILVFLLVNLIFEDKRISLFTSLLFAVHPIHTEAVSYIAGRADILGTLFLLVSFIFYLKYMQEEKVHLYIILLVAYILSLLSRENSLIFPLLLLCYHWIFKKRLYFKSFISILAVSILYIILRLGLLPFYPRKSTTTLFERVPGFFNALADYFKLLILPLNLHMEYGMKLFHISDPKTIIGIIILLLLLSVMFIKRHTDKIISFSIAWFLITLMPASNLYPLNAYMAEHWLYLPSIGFFLLLAYVFYKGKRILFVCLIALIFLYSFLTIRQNNYWLDPISFFTRTLHYAPDSYNAYFNLAVAYNDIGNVDEAQNYYKKAIEIAPLKSKAYINLAALYANIGRTEDAVSLLNKSIGLNPGIAEGYGKLGAVYAMMGNNDEALRLIRKAIELDADYTEGYLNLGAIYVNTGEIEKAILSYKHVLEINPNSTQSYYCLGRIYQSVGDKKEAIASYEKAIGLDCSILDAYINLSSLLGESGLYRQALNYLNRALKIYPGSSSIYNNLGVTYAKMKQWTEAQKAWEKALAINPADKDAHNNLRKLKSFEKIKNIR